MARTEANKRKAKMATMREVLDRARETERFTSDADIEALVGVTKGGSGAEFRTALSFLTDAIIHLPRGAKTLQARLSRAEAESVRVACGVCEMLMDEFQKHRQSDWLEIRIAVLKLDAALVRLAILAQ